MPRTSQKQEILDCLYDELFYREVEGGLQQLLESKPTPDPDQLLELIFLIQSQRYINPRVQIPKQQALRDLFFSFPDSEFIQICRVTKDTFRYIENLISNHEIFLNNSNNPQQHVWVQLMVAMERFGTNGNGSSVGRIARQGGIGNGTVSLYTDRVKPFVMNPLTEGITYS